jgi:mycothiol synthase
MSITVGPATITEWRTALELLSSPLIPDFRSQQIELALQLLNEGKLDPAGLIVSRIDQEIIAVGLGECTPGQIGIMWPPIGSEAATPEQVTEVLEAVFAYLKHRDMAVSVAFIPWNDQRSGLVLERGLFRHVTNLVDMQRLHTFAAPTSTQSSRLKVSHFNAETSSAFKHALMQTYQDSMDAPELNGIRTSEQIIRGYEATSPNRSDWWLLQHEDHVVGVMILTIGEVPNHPAEITYLGLIPSQRRKGFGREALDLAMAEGALRGVTVWTVQIDERNEPAKALYFKNQFVPTSEKQIYYRTM